MARSSWRLTSEQKDSIVQEYAAGANSKELGRKYGIADTGIRHIIKKRGGSMRSNVDCHRTISFNEVAFDAVTEESAYWIGFLMADGTIVKSEGHSPALILGLAPVDTAHVEKFKSFLKSSHVVMDSTAKCGKYGVFRATRFSVRSQKLVDALAKFGVVPNKSKRAQVIGLENDRNFWRGVIDGDGCVHVRKAGTPSLTLVGSKELLTQFVSYTQSIGVQSHATIRPHSSIFQIAFVGSSAKQILAHLYQDASIVLDRKAEAVKKVLVPEVL